MADTASITVHKSFMYRGVREVYDTTHHLDQVPASNANWSALGHEVALREANALPSSTWFVALTGHAPGNPVAVFEEDLSAAAIIGGFIPGGADFGTPGDCAVWVRWGTTQLSVRGKPIYLRNYYHDVFWNGTKDTFAPDQAAQLMELGLAFQNGMVGGTQTFHRAGPRGAVAQSHDVSEWITTRTLRKRGKRKKVATKLLVPGLSIPPGDYTIN